jgi:hypothetical protein
LKKQYSAENVTKVTALRGVIDYGVNAETVETLPIPIMEVWAILVKCQ